MDSMGIILAALGDKEEPGVESSITPDLKGARVFDIPMNSGILNQEGQAADCEGGFWVLNRENGSGQERWILYHRDRTGMMTICSKQKFD